MENIDVNVLGVQIGGDLFFDFGIFVTGRSSNGVPSYEIMKAFI